MTALQINDIKTFMNAMLKGTLFDNFLLKEASITHNITWTIDGAINKACISNEDMQAFDPESSGYVRFSAVKPVCFDIIKGKTTPAFFKFVFMLSPKNKEKTIASSGSNYKNDDISAMSINVIYKNDILICTTGISYRVFSRDKTLENEWDRMAGVFLRQNKISITVI